MTIVRRAFKTSTAYWFAVALIIGVAALLRIPSLYEPYWYGDEGIFAAAAYDVRSGGTLYSDAWDNKPPLVFYTYAFVQALFGNGMFALHVAASASVLVTTVLVMWLGNRLYGRAASIVGGVVFALVMCTPVIEGNLAMTETFMILATSAAVTLFVVSRTRDDDDRQPWLIGAGLCIGVAILYKQVAAFDGLAILVMASLTSRAAWKEHIALSVGIAAPIAVSIAYFLAAGAFEGYWYAVVGSLPLYSDLGPEGGTVTRILGLLPAIVVAWWLAWRRRDGLDIGIAHLPPLWLAFAFAGATSSSLEFPHYLQQAAPPLALTIAGVPMLLRDLPRAERALMAGAAVCMAGVALLQFGQTITDRHQLHPLPYYRNYLSYTTGGRDHQAYERFFDGKAEAIRDISAAIDEDRAGTTLYTWAELPWLYAAGGYDNPTRYYTSFLGELIPNAKKESLEDLDRAPPAYVVISDTTYAPFDGLELWVAERYVKIEERGDWRLYRLAALAGSLPAVDAEESVGR